MSSVLTSVLQSPVNVERLEQHLSDGSTNPDWLLWREQKYEDDRPRITATAAVAAVGSSEYQSRYDLWLKLTGQPLPEKTQDKGSEFAKAKGLKNEESARLTLATFLSVSPETIEPCLVSRSGQFAWVAASLDAALTNGDQVLAIGEYKLNGKPRHSLAEMGVVPRDHFLQMQWQMLASNAPRGYYVSTPFSGPGASIVIDVAADASLQEWMLQTVENFRDCCATSNLRPPPELMNYEPSLKRLAFAYHSALKQLATLQATVAAHESTLLAAIQARTGDDRFVGLGVIAELKSASPSTSWAKLVKEKLPGLTDADLAPYRKSASPPKFVLSVSDDAEGFIACQQWEMLRESLQTTQHVSATTPSFTDW